MVDTVVVMDEEGGPGRAAAPPAVDSSATGLRTGAVLCLLGIFAAALLLRLFRLDHWGMWIDELFSVTHAAELPLGIVDWRFFAWLPHLIGFELAGVDMASVVPQEVWTWRAAGVTEWNLRAPVAVLGAVSILVLGLVARRILGIPATLWLCLLLALSPWHLWVSQLGRFYIQLFLLYNLALLLYYEATTQGRLGRAAGAMVCVVLAFYTSPIALMILAVYGVDIAVSWWRRRPTGMRPAFWAVGAAAIVLCAVGILTKFTDRPQEYAAFVGTEQSIPVMTMGMVYLIGLPMVVMAALGFWTLVQRNERLAILLAAAAVVPLAVFVVFNLLGKDTHVRYLFVALFAWLALTAVAIELVVTALRPRCGALVAALPAMALVSTFVLADYIYMTSGTGYRAMWPQATAYIAAHRQPGELVGGDWGGHRMLGYYLGEPDAILLPDGFTERDMLNLVPGPTWILIRSYHPSSGDRSDQLEAAGTLRTYFTNRVAQPNHTLNVYYYTPPVVAEPDAGAQVSGADS